MQHLLLVILRLARVLPSLFCTISVLQCVNVTLRHSFHFQSSYFVSERAYYQLRQLKCLGFIKAGGTFACATQALASCPRETILFRVTPFPTVIAVPLECLRWWQFATFALVFATISFAFACLALLAVSFGIITFVNSEVSRLRRQPSSPSKGSLPQQSGTNLVFMAARSVAVQTGDPICGALTLWD